jgi:hypothetical protein
MTISEKIFAMHDLNHKGFVAPGDIIRRLEPQTLCGLGHASQISFHL